MITSERFETIHNPNNGNISFRIQDAKKSDTGNYSVFAERWKQLESVNLEFKNSISLESLSSPQNVAGILKSLNIQVLEGLDEESLEIKGSGIFCSTKEAKVGCLISIVKSESVIHIIIINRALQQLYVLLISQYHLPWEM